MSTCVTFVNPFEWIQFRLVLAAMSDSDKQDRPSVGELNGAGESEPGTRDSGSGSAAAAAASTDIEAGLAAAPSSGSTNQPTPASSNHGPTEQPSHTTTAHQGSQPGPSSPTGAMGEGAVTFHVEADSDTDMETDATSTPATRSKQPSTSFRAGNGDVTRQHVSSSATYAPTASSTKAAAAVPLPQRSATPDPAAHPDYDYEGTGIGFVPLGTLQQGLSLTRAGAASLQRELALELAEIRVDGGTAPGAVKTGTIRRQDGTISKLGPQSLLEQGAPIDPDALWLLKPEAVAQRFSDSGIDVANPRGSRGLSGERAAELLQLNGKNELAPPKQTPEIIKFLRNFLDPLSLLLTLAAILSIAVSYPIDTSNTLNLYLGIVLIVLILFDATFAYVQEGKASDVMKSFKKMMSPQARVIRDGQVQSVNATDLVVGDLLMVSGGDVIPADMRLVWTQDCKVETSSLTGESLPITCSLSSGGAEKIEQAKNICFNSSKCLEGECLGVVFATGNDTLIGTIASLAGTTTGEMTPLQREIHIFVQWITVAGLTLGTIFFIISGARQGDWLYAFTNVFIVVLIANVPQGLHITVISQLTVMAKRMAERRVFVKELKSVETLGSITVIATDKTGTLTQNKMSVANMWFDGHTFSAASIMQNYPVIHSTRKKQASVEGSDGDGSESPHATLNMLERIAVICSKTRFADERVLNEAEARQLEQWQSLQTLDTMMTIGGVRSQFPTIAGRLDPNLTMRSGKSKLLESLADVVMDDEKREVIGDASETALFNFVRQRRSIELMRYHYPTVYAIPFNSRNKYAITIMRAHAVPGESADKRVLLMKGAPEVVVSRCSHYMHRGQVKPIDARFTEEFDAAYRSFGSRGERVLGFAMLNLPADKFGPKFDGEYAKNSDVIPTSGLVFVGLTSLVDPPKASVPQAVSDCHQAGIKVIMVTGDHPLTASAIARQVNIFQPGCLTRDELATLHDCAAEEVPDEDVDCIVVRGPDLDSFSEEDWEYTLNKQNIVFARTTPQQKLQIVEHLQAMGHIVAVTGDGVNDSPALKRANLGAAMGINGSDVARDAADVIIMDDDFSSIVVGVRMGRTIFDNISKTIAYTITHTSPELIPALIAIALGFPIALSAIMLLTIDLFTELAPAISLAYEPSEADVMSRPPRNAKTDRLASWQLISYSFLQAGLIECISAYIGFFLVFEYYGMAFKDLFNTNFFQENTDEDMPTFPGCHTLADNPPFPTGSVCYNAADQQEVLFQAQTAYYAILVFSQVAHIWLCKTRTESLFTHGVFRNEFTLPAVIVEICLLLLFILPPSSKDVIYTSPFPPRFWPLILIPWTALFIWQEGRKWYVRRHPHSFIAKHVHW